MIYRLLNSFLERKIEKIRPEAIGLLNRSAKAFDESFEKADLKVRKLFSDKWYLEQNKANKITVEARIAVDKQYILISHHYKYDAKRRYMVNSNYLKYLRAIIYLYSTGPSAGTGILSAPAEVYAVINSVQKSFNEIMFHLKFNQNENI